MLFILCWNCNQLDAWIVWKFVAAIIAADHQMSLVGPVFDAWNFHIFYLYNEKEVTEASQGFMGLSLICGRKWMGYSICKLCALATFILLIHSDWEEECRECLKVKICNPASDLTHTNTHSQGAFTSLRHSSSVKECIYPVCFSNLVSCDEAHDQLWVNEPLMGQTHNSLNN